MADWWPSEEEYTPGIDKQKWLELLRNPKVFDDDSLAIMKRMLDIGGAATCKQLSQKYGETVTFYNFGSVRLARRILKETNCRVLPDEKSENSKLWPILYQGKYADKNTEGIYVWQLRDELREALKEIDLSEIPLSLHEDEDFDEDNDNNNGSEEYDEDDAGQAVNQKQYWLWYLPGYSYDQFWDKLFFPSGFLSLGYFEELNDWNHFESKKSVNDEVNLRFATELWQFAHEMSIGDIVFAGRDHSNILARGVVESKYIFDSNRKMHKHIRKVRWTHVGKWKHDNYVSDRLTDISPRQEYVKQLEALVRNSEILTGLDNQINSTTTINKRYWLFVPPGSRGDKSWARLLDEGIMCLNGWNSRLWDDLGDLTEFDSKESLLITFSICDNWYISQSIWDFSHEMAIDDVIIAKNGNILGRGIIESDYIFDANQNGYRHFRKVRWTHKGTWKFYIKDTNIPNIRGAVNITNEQDIVAEIETMILGSTDLNDIANLHDLSKISEPFQRAIASIPYTESDFLKEVFIAPDRYATLKKLLGRKKNVILKGPPGVGKTFAAKRLVYSIMGEKDDDRVKVVQFHQSYSYEDFVMGYRPTEGGFHLMEGPFCQFCEVAANDPDRPHFFIIDEINRGNLSKIFGELLMLIEGDKRGQSMRLMYSDEPFSVPENLYIIGMMNTADRSLALIDYALRRRFAFFDMEPAFDSKGFKDYQSKIKNAKFDSLITAIKELNKTIKDSLGMGFRIGHSYFCANDSTDVDDEWLLSVVEFELIPLLEEYWFDEPSKVEHWSDKLRDALHG